MNAISFARCAGAALIVAAILTGCSKAPIYAVEDSVLALPGFTYLSQDNLPSESESCRMMDPVKDEIGQDFGDATDFDRAHKILAKAQEGMRDLQRCANNGVILEYVTYFRFMRAWADSYDGVDPYGDIAALKQIFQAYIDHAVNEQTSLTAKTLMAEVGRFQSRLSSGSDEVAAADATATPGFPCHDTAHMLDDMDAQSLSIAIKTLSSAERSNASCSEEPLRSDNESRISLYRARNELSQHQDAWRSDAARADQLAHDLLAGATDTALQSRLRDRRRAIYQLYQENP